MEPTPKKKNPLVLIVAALLIVGASAGTYLYLKSPEKVETTPTKPTAAETPTTVAPLYGNPEPSVPVQMPEIPAITENQPPTKNELPLGFGLEAPTTTKQAQAPTPTPASPAGLERNPVELETPAGPPPTPDNGSVQAVDPREIGVTTNDGPEKNFEETALTVQRTLTAVLNDGDKQMIRMRVPVMYKSRTLRLEGESEKEARQILADLKTKEKELASLKSQLENLLSRWNKLVEKTSPQEVLLPESPTLPQNQSSTPLNRQENNELSPGKAIRYEILSSDKQ